MPTNERERIVRMLRGERDALLPWATRLDLWHTSRTRTNSLPAEVADMDLMQIHRHLGIGRQNYATLVSTRLRGVEVRLKVDGAVVKRMTDPCLSFPVPYDFAIADRIGDQRIEFHTPVGTAQIVFRMTDELISSGVTSPYLVKHILEEDAEYEVVKWILDHAEILPDFEPFERSEAELGGDGFTIGMMQRVPFQRLLLDFMGEERAVFHMLDQPKRFRYLLDVLAEHGRQALKLALETPALMLEFPDNFDGFITSPKLFRDYCMPFLQESAERIHAAGRFLGSHMDGDMKPLLHLVPESGVDVVESFSPVPLSSLTFQEAWETWRDKVLMWGAIPSPIFEPQFSEGEFEKTVSRMLDLIGDDGHIILGIGDQAVSPTLMSRIRRVSEMLGR